MVDLKLIKTEELIEVTSLSRLLLPPRRAFVPIANHIRTPCISKVQVHTNFSPLCIGGSNFKHALAKPFHASIR